MKTPPVINEQCSATISIALADKDGNPAPPVNVGYRIDCMSTGTSILSGGALGAPGPSFTLDVSKEANAIINQTNIQEYKRLTIVADYTNGDRLTAQFDWIINNLNFIG